MSPSEQTEHSQSVHVHINKAQFGASQWAEEELEQTAMHPSVKDSFGLVLTAFMVHQCSPLVPAEYQTNNSNIMDIQNYCGTTDLNYSPIKKQVYEDGFQKFRDRTPGAGADFNEADFFEQDFQENFWGAENYARLKSIKMLDHTGIFYCHNCGGSEEWEEGGMCRL